MARIRLNTAAISDWPSFHRECQRALGFPAFYGATMDAWIDCLSDLRANEGTGMSTVSLGRDEVLFLEIPDAERFRQRVPDIGNAMWDCAAFVNQRYVDAGESPAIAFLLVEA